MSTLCTMARWGGSLTLDQVPAEILEDAKNQVLSTLAAVHSGFASDLGQPITRAILPSATGDVLAPPSGDSMSADRAATLMSAWSMVLDFDDVMLGGHTGHSSVLVPLTYAQKLGKTGADALLAQLVANEIGARINMVCAVGKTRGQMATHLHLIGAAAARSKLEELDEHRFSQAICFALSYPAKALFPAFLGSDAKVFCASWPIRIGLESVDAVLSGLRASDEILEDGRGFFASSAEVPVLDFLDGLGSRWHTETNSYKIYPACGYLNGVLDATLSLVQNHQFQADDIRRVDIYSSIFTAGMDAHSAPYLRGGISAIATLTFCTPYTVACAILYRTLDPSHFKQACIRNPKIWELAERVRVHHDPELTIAALLGDIPIGAALKRVSEEQARHFLRGLGLEVAASAEEVRKIVSAVSSATDQSDRPLDLRNSTKPLGARVKFSLRNGEEFSESVAIPRAFAGAEDRELVRTLMRRKFLKSAKDNIGESEANEAADIIENLEEANFNQLKKLMKLNCTA